MAKATTATLTTKETKKSNMTSIPQRKETISTTTMVKTTTTAKETIGIVMSKGTEN